jgi:hypothetical protein
LRTIINANDRHRAGPPAPSNFNRKKSADLAADSVKCPKAGFIFILRPKENSDYMSTNLSFLSKVILSSAHCGKITQITQENLLFSIDLAILTPVIIVRLTLSRHREIRKNHENQ